MILLLSSRVLIASILFSIMIRQANVMADTYRGVYDFGLPPQSIGIGSADGFTNDANTVVSNPSGLIGIGTGLYGFASPTFGGSGDTISGALSWSVSPYISIGSGMLRHSLNGTAGFTSDYAHTTTEMVLSSAIDPLAHLKLGAWLHRYSQERQGAELEGMGLDVGARFDTALGNVALALQNLTQNKLASNGTRLTVPQQFSLGYQSRPLLFMRATMYTQLKGLSDIDGASFGVGVRIYPTQFWRISIGQRDIQLSSRSTKSTMTFGTSLNFRWIALNYAIDRSKTLQGTPQHYVSISLKYPNAEWYPEPSWHPQIKAVDYPDPSLYPAPIWHLDPLVSEPRMAPTINA